MIKRQQVPPGRSVEYYRSFVREDFRWTCAYCSIAETEATGIGFEIDHYQPTAKGGTNSFDNLVYSCRVCNRKKSAWWQVSTVRTPTFFLLRPDQHKVHAHISLDRTDETRVEHRTSVGEGNIALLDLNRPALREMRKLRRERGMIRQEILWGLQELIGSSRVMLNRRDRSTLAKLKAYFTELASAGSGIIGVHDLEPALRSKLLDREAPEEKRTRLANRDTDLIRCGVISPYEDRKKGKKDRRTGKPTRKSHRKRRAKRPR